jgi:hypothetical protein
MKQLEPQCVCGRRIIFPRKRFQARCPSCGVKWEKDTSGCWAVGLNTVLFTPAKPNRYVRYMRWRESQKGRKAARR